MDLLDQAGDVSGKADYQDFLQGLQIIASADDFQALSHAVPRWQSTLAAPPDWLNPGF